MLVAASALKDLSILASDGRLGSVSDILFDDRSWTIKWLVVDHGGWLAGRKVVVHPSAVAHVDFELRQIQVRMTRAQVQASPDIATHEPVSRQMEIDIHEYYGWDPCWGSSYFIPGAMASPLSTSPYFGVSLASDGWKAEGSSRGDMHLRSVAEVTGYHPRAVDGTIGHVEGVFIDDASWDVRYLIVDTKNWWPGAHVLISPFAVTSVDCPTREIHLNVDREQVKASPAWDPAKMIDELYEKRLHRHYNWLGYGF